MQTNANAANANPQRPAALTWVSTDQGAQASQARETPSQWNPSRISVGGEQPAQDALQLQAPPVVIHAAAEPLPLSAADADLLQYLCANVHGCGVAHDAIQNFSAEFTGSHGMGQVMQRFDEIVRMLDATLAPAVRVFFATRLVRAVSRMSRDTPLAAAYDAAVQARMHPTDDEERARFDALRRRAAPGGWSSGRCDDRPRGGGFNHLAGGGADGRVA